MVNYKEGDGTDSLATASLMDRVRLLEQRGKYLLETSSVKPPAEYSNLRRALSTSNLFNDSDPSKTDSAYVEMPLTEEKRVPLSSFIAPLPPLPLSSARRLFRSSTTLFPPNIEITASPKFLVETNPSQQVVIPPPSSPDALWSLQQELSQLALQREEERARLTTALNQMRSSAEQSRAEYERRLIDKEEALSRLEYNYDQSNKRIENLEEELTVTHEALTSQERELERVRSELSLHNSAANQLRVLLNEFSEKLQLSGVDSGDDVLAVPPLPPPSCQSVMVLTHSVSTCIRAAWDQTATARAYCDRLISEVTSVKLECARTIEKMEANRARAIAAIQSEAEHALKLGQQRLSAAQDRLRALEDQHEVMREDLTKQLSLKDAQIENMRVELHIMRESGERERAEAIGRATDAERALGESEANRLRSAALASDADARSRQLELELDEMKRRYAQLESELAGEHERLCRIWHADDTRASRMRETESRETLLRRRVAELEEDLQSNIIEFQKTITDLSAKNEQCSDELISTREQVVQLSKELEKTLECMGKYKTELERMTRIANENVAFRNEANDNMKLLEDSTTKCITLEKSKERLEEELETCCKEMDQLRKDSIASRLAAAESVKAAQLLTERHRELESQAKEENTKLREEVDKLLQNLGEQETRLAALSAEKKQMEAASGCQQSDQLTAMRALAKKLANAERQLVLLGRIVNPGDVTSRSDMDTCVSKLKHSEERLRDALNDLKEANTQRKDADKRANEATLVVKKLKEKLDTERSRVSYLHREAAKFHAEAQNYRGQLEAASSYVSRLESELVRRAKAGFVMKEPPFHNSSVKEKTLLSVLADKDDSSEAEKESGRRRRRRSSRRHENNKDKQLILSPKNLSPVFFEFAKMVLPTIVQNGSQISVSTST